MRDKERYQRNISAIQNADTSHKVINTMNEMSQVGMMYRKYRGNKAIEKNEEIVKENKRILMNLGLIMSGQDYHSQKHRQKYMPRPEIQDSTRRLQL